MRKTLVWAKNISKKSLDIYLNVCTILGILRFIYHNHSQLFLYLQLTITLLFCLHMWPTPNTSNSLVTGADPA